MKTNKLKYCIFITCFFITSCSLFFEPEETSVSRIETYEQLVDAVGGVYGQFRQAVDTKTFQFINFNGDDIFSVGGNLYRTYYQGDSSDCWTTNEHLMAHNENYVYTSLYEVLTTLNNILTQFDVGSVKVKSIREVLGELYFIRAYCYFRLGRTYDRPPLISDSNISYSIARPSFAEIYESIEYDLLKAIRLLPANNSENRVPYETPHRGTAKALLAEVYLNWGGYPVKDNSKYSLAMQTAGEVIDSADFFGFGLISDFAALWDGTNPYNNELVFTVFGAGYLYNADCQKRFYSDSISTIYNGFSTDNQFFYSTNFYTEVEFYNNYPKNYRKEITFFTRIYVPNENWVRYYQLDTGYFYIEQIDECSRVSFRKFYLDTILVPEEIRGTLASSLPVYKYDLYGCPRIYLLRYAQTLLTYAEAAARSGNLDEKAYNCVNMVRRRANNLNINAPSEFDLTGLSPEAFADSVVAERSWELAGEPEGRWFDLLRLEKMEEVLGREDNTFFRIKKIDGYFIPIPEEDVLLNPNLGEKE
ncbi:MAG: RagB/SusD family nutrient uptake outer membrane protein [Prolixibacteraceae bacterium]|nr:RagB/SusD family nutrient uptake outer membrane protein [Prolixibacteraceae bacterium]